MTWILRFLGKMPRGRFEYTCGICGNYEIVNIPKGIDKITFNCKCGATINIWEQTDHWHISIQ